MYPGEIVSKDPTVKNVGNNPCLVRVKVEWPEGVDLDYLTDGVEYKLGENWTARDGVYYYQSILDPETVTDALFDEIRLAPETTNGTGEEMHIVITAEAVQAEGALLARSRPKLSRLGLQPAWVNNSILFTLHSTLPQAGEKKNHEMVQSEEMIP